MDVITEVQKKIKAEKVVSFPNKKNEEYKYCDVEKVWNQGFLNDSHYSSEALNTLIENTISNYLISNESVLFVVVNGSLRFDLSSNIEHAAFEFLDFNAALQKYPKQIETHFGKIANADSDPLVALNTSNFAEGLFLKIKKNSIVQGSITLLNISISSQPISYNSRQLILIEENAELTINELFVSDEATQSFANNVTEVFVAQNAKVNFIRLQDENTNSNLFCNLWVTTKKDSVFSDHLFTLSGSVVRNNTTVILSDSNTEAHLNGLYLLQKNQLVDNHTLVDHQMPNCYSNELYKGVMDDKSTAVFNGKIFVRKDAQKTNAYQSNRNILLSPNATINTKPQLEIYADDVKCSHGTSTGKLDDTALFYLKSRGIGFENAQKLLLQAFVSEVYEKLPNQEFKSIIQNRIEQRFS
ncbi:MAG: Fe-S cluster assembly protein SufD [Bacteroidota bacterium]|jgi:Fe-S cluster assembly protein SufD